MMPTTNNESERLGEGITDANLQLFAAGKLDGNSTAYLKIEADFMANPENGRTALYLIQLEQFGETELTDVDCDVTHVRSRNEELFTRWRQSTLNNDERQIIANTLASDPAGELATMINDYKQRTSHVLDLEAESSKLIL